MPKAMRMATTCRRRRPDLRSSRERRNQNPVRERRVFLCRRSDNDGLKNVPRVPAPQGNKVAELMICPIYANLPTELQAKIFDPTPEGARKVSRACWIPEMLLTTCRRLFSLPPSPRRPLRLMESSTLSTLGLSSRTRTILVQEWSPSSSLPCVPSSSRRSYGLDLARVGQD